jgi:hypothetical protein
MISKAVRGLVRRSDMTPLADLERRRTAEADPSAAFPRKQQIRLLTGIFCMQSNPAWTRISDLSSSFSPRSITASHGDDSLPLTMDSQLPYRPVKSEPLHFDDDIGVYKREYAEALDEKDSLRDFRDRFIIPSKKDLTRKRLEVSEGLLAPLSFSLVPLPPKLYS